MKNQVLKEALINSPETTVKVSHGLHQNIMRSVRLAQQPGIKTVSRWLVPLWATALGVVALTFFYLAPSAIDTNIQPPVMAQVQEPVEQPDLLTFGDQLAALSGNHLNPEKDLREELARLKADLNRLGFKS